MYTLKEVLNSGEKLIRVLENKYCFIFYTNGKNTKFRDAGETGLLRWGFDKETNQVGFCDKRIFFISFARDDRQNLAEVDPKVLEKYIDRPIRSKKVFSSSNDYADDYI